MSATRCAFLVLLLAVGCGGESPQSIPRERTLIVAYPTSGHNQIQDYDSFNPFLPGLATRSGYNFLYEPLYFYNVEEDSLISWIAGGHRYSADFREIEIEIRPGVEWSDGEPWTARDLVFTIDMLRSNYPHLLFSTDMDAWVEAATVVDDLKARIRLKAPNPRFLFTYFTHHFDNGIPIVPRHIWQGQDPQTFTNLDLERGWPVVSGPYRMVVSEPQQRIYALRRTWWAHKIGFQQLPRVERLVYVPSQGEDKRVQNLLLDNLDTSLDLRPTSIKTLLEQNPAISTWTGTDPPYGSLNSWTVSLGFNNLEAPFADPQIRKAINHAIDRKELVEVGWQGSGSYALLPFPDFAPMRKFTDGLRALVEKYQVGLYDPEKTARILRGRGWRRDGQGYWAKDGQRLKILIESGEIFQDLTPVLVAQLQRAGFAAGFRMTADSYTRMSQGHARTYLMGHPGSVRDPHHTLSFYHSRFVRPTGESAEYFWRWRNEAFDALVDRMGQRATQDPELAALFAQAMDIWLRELPSIPIVQWYHRVPYNQTYWTNWPTAANPYTQNAFWHRTWLLVLLALQPTR
jgi:peptide/nickel transport system substrate-binding protein